MLQCVAVCCSVLQGDAVQTTQLPPCAAPKRCRGYYLQVCCSVLQCVAICCGELQRDAVQTSQLPPCAAPKGAESVMCECVAVRCTVLQCVAVCCNALQCVAVPCSVSHCVAVCCSVMQFRHPSLRHVLLPKACAVLSASVLQCNAVVAAVFDSVL